MKILKTGFDITMVMFLAWFLISYLEIAIFNTSNPSYHSWNMFLLLFGGGF